MKKIFTLALFAVLKFNAQTIYVSPSGDDTNLGTTVSPLATIEEALTQLDASGGGTCILKDGRYHEAFNLDDVNGITIQAENEGKAIIDGTIDINSTWNQDADDPNIWETTLTEDIWQLFIDDEQQVMARWPNAQFYDDSIFSKDTWASGDQFQEDGVTEITNGTLLDEKRTLTDQGFDATGAVMVAVLGSSKTVYRDVISHSGNRLTYDPITITYYAKHQKYYLECKKDFLDVENEWFYDKDTKKLYVYGNPTGKSIKGKTQSYFMTSSGISNFEIKDVNFFGTTFNFRGAENINIYNCNFAYPNCTKRMLKIDDTVAYDDTFKPHKGPRITYIEGSKSSDNPSNITIEKCLFEHTDGEAIQLVGNNNVIKDSYFHHIDYSVTSLRNLGSTILSTGENNKFHNNMMHTLGASVTLDLGSYPDVAYNDISNTGLLQNDGAIMQLTNKHVPNCNIHHNWFHDSQKTGVRFDAPGGEPEKAGNFGLIHHNVLWNLEGGAIMAKGDNQNIYNNTLFNNANNNGNKVDLIIISNNSCNVNSNIHNNLTDRMSGERNAQAAVPGDIRNNEYSGTEDDHGVYDVLVNPDNRDFTPKDGSIAHNTGLILNDELDINDFYYLTNDTEDDLYHLYERRPDAFVLNEDLQFTATAENPSPDLGAYERGETPWTAGISWTPDFYPWGTVEGGSILINDAEAVEGNKIKVELTTTQGFTDEFTVDFVLESLTANNKDYNDKVYSVKFNANVTKHFVEIETVEDALIESNEKFIVKIKAVTGVKFKDTSDTATLTILDNDGVVETVNGFVRNPSFDMNPDFINWTTNGEAADTFTLENETSGSDVGTKCFKIHSTVDNSFSTSTIESDLFEVTGDNANPVTARVSYYAKTDITGGINAKVWINEQNNAITNSRRYTYTTEWVKYEHDVTIPASALYDFSVKFELGKAFNGSIYIDNIETSLEGGVDLDGGKSTVLAAINETTVNENDGNLSLEVELTEASDVDTQISIELSDIDTNAADFNHTDLTVIIPAGEIKRTATINILDDNDIEGDEKFGAVISNITNANETIDFSSTPVELTIVDNDIELGDFELTINQDAWAYDISIQIKDENTGNIVFSYDFTNDDNNKTTRTYFDLADGDYELVITDAFGDGIIDGLINLIDTRDSDVVIENEDFNLLPTKTIPFSVGAFLSKGNIDNNINKFSVYPNPVNDRINISSGIKIYELNIYDIQGKKVYSNKTNSLNESLSLSSFQNGIYLLETKFENDKVEVKRIIKK